MKFKLLLFFFLPILLNSQTLEVGRITTDYNLNGILSEHFWNECDSISNLTMIEPNEANTPTFKTIVKIVANENTILIGIKCYDNEPDKIVAYSKARDVNFSDEDNIKFVIAPYMDGRSGYVFAINPYAARSDGLLYPMGYESKSWDGIWDAATAITEEGWSAEIYIPATTLNFPDDATEWSFNIERKIQRLLETNRWAGINKNYQVIKTSQAGKITNLPKFDLGLALLVKLSALGDIRKQRDQNTEFNYDGSIDIVKKINSDITSYLTINTDFAETEVDTRRTNLTRFPLFFPEKRGFFLEGEDIFDYGFGLGRNTMPFFSRRIGLYGGREVPIIWGLKTIGKINTTTFGSLITRTDNLDSTLAPATMGAFRIRQDVLEESYFGFIGTFGDPTSNCNGWLVGADFTFQTSKIFGNKVFLAGVWGLITQPQSGEKDRTAIGVKVSYPNDLWEFEFTGRRIGKYFNPILGFLRRSAVWDYDFKIKYSPRPDIDFIRQLFFSLESNYITNLDRQWENYYLTITPLEIAFESGDKFKFSIKPTGENLPYEFTISDGVIIPMNEYHWWRYMLSFTSANKRKISGYANWGFGSFYDGNLNEITCGIDIRSLDNLHLGIDFTKNIVKLPYGDFEQNLISGKLDYNFSSNLQITSFVQYDNESQSIGMNNRLRWTFDPLGDLFIVYNHNAIRNINDKWLFDSNQFILKVRYGIWF